MAKTIKRFARQSQRASYKIKVQKLQSAGLLGKVNLSKKASPEVIRKFEKYKSLLAGHASAVKAPDVKTAAKLRKQLGLKGSGKTIVVPKEKKERYRFRKSTNEIVSTRPGYNEGETITKTLGSRFIAPPEQGEGKRLYYTIPSRMRGEHALKRTTFSSFDELLYYLHKYEVNFEDVEDRIEIEEVTIGSRKDKIRRNKIHREREAAIARHKRKRGSKKRKASKRSSKRRR